MEESSNFWPFSEFREASETANNNNNNDIKTLRES